MRVLGIVPARGGSQRVPGKNLRILGGKPLVAWAIEAALVAKGLDRVVVSSDDEAILDVARRYGPELPLRRPPELATDTSPAIDYVRHALESLEAPGEPACDVVTIIQPSTPFVQSGDIEATLALLEASGADTAVSVCRLDQMLHPLKLKVLDGDRLLPYLEEEAGRMAAHEIPPVYSRNGAVYATRRQVVEAGRIIGDDCCGYVMPRERSVDINDELDLLFAEFLLSSAQATDSPARPTMGGID